MFLKNKQEFEIPDHEIHTLAQVLLPILTKFYEDEDVQEEFRKWQEQRNEAKK